MSTNRIPNSFDYIFYAKDKPFLKNEKEAINHYKTIGQSAGLPSSPLCDLGQFLNFIKQMNANLILEIGPGASPRLKGTNVRYFDVKTTQNLIDRYRNNEVQGDIPSIDYVDAGGDLKIIPDKFDVIFSSHVIEHTSDLVDHLNSVESILNPNGFYFLVVPNKKYTYDFFKPLTNLEDVLDKHLGNTGMAQTLSLRSVLLETIYRTHNNPKEHWVGEHGSFTYDSARVIQALKKFDFSKEDPIYKCGFHNWFFTEDNFHEIFNKLYDIGLTRFRVSSILNTTYGNCSFFAILSR